jgi:O-antigen/teichoic acid export membrane protein
LLTLLDQGLIGGANFLIAILLARQLLPEQYGAYALVFGIFLVFSIVYACLILEPMLVFGSSVYRDNFRQYFGVLLWMHVAIALTIVLFLGGSAWVAYELGRSPSLPRALVGAMLAGPLVFLFWLVRRAFYVKLDPKTAVLGGLLYCAVLLAGVLICYKLRLLSPFVAFLLMAAGALGASPMLLGRLKPSLSFRPTCPTLREVVSRHWVYGRWALAASVAGWISGNVYYILLSSMRGLADTGALKALLNLTSPVGQVFAGLSLLAFPYAARTHRESGAIGVERLSWRLTPLYAGGTVAYWIVLLLLKHPIVHFLYAGKYLQVEYLIPCVALGAVFRIAAEVQIISLKASQSPFLSFVAFFSSDVVACVVGVPAVWAFGLQGAIWAYVFSGATTLIAGFLLMRRIARRVSSEQLGSTIPEISPLANPDALKSSIPIS